MENGEKSIHPGQPGEELGEAVWGGHGCIVWGISVLCLSEVIEISTEDSLHYPPRTHYFEPM